jgi:hypothetical protein
MWTTWLLALDPFGSILLGCLTLAWRPASSTAHQASSAGGTR